MPIPFEMSKEESDRDCENLFEIDCANPQPLPKNGKERIVDLVMADLARRAETGRIKYGTYLQSHNGRNALIDAYQEALDLCMYLRQAIEEQKDA
jgi:hypothetical protein